MAIQIETETEKLTAICAIVELWTEHNNDEDGDRHLSDAQLAIEAIDDVLIGNVSSGALRTFTEGLANRRI